jgi:hypothetical protein
MSKYRQDEPPLYSLVVFLQRYSAPRPLQLHMYSLQDSLRYIAGTCSSLVVAFAMYPLSNIQLADPRKHLLLIYFCIDNKMYILLSSRIDFFSFV